MLIRFLIVLLAILNIGVALWWLAPRTPAAAEPAASEPGVATLELLPPHAGAAAPVPAATPVAREEKPAETTTPRPEPAAAAPRCFSLGPFADAAQAQAAQAALGAEVARSQVREAAGKPAASYRVIIPPATSREEAQAMTRRITEAGFGDFFIMGQGEEANAIALGQYRNREGAERRVQALVAAGFPAQLVGSGAEGAANWWLDMAVAGATGGADWQRRSGAAQQRSLDCAQLR